MDPLQKAETEGWTAGYHDEQPDCPYPEGSDLAIAWWEGYWQGSRDC